MLPVDVRIETVAFHLLKQERAERRLEELRKQAKEAQQPLSLSDQYTVLNG